MTNIFPLKADSNNFILKLIYRLFMFYVYFPIGIKDESKNVQ